MTSSSNTNSLEQLITCPVCQESFDDPRLLPCSHTYCRKCMEEQASANKDQFECPSHDGTLVIKNDIQSLPLNQVARDLVELYNSTQHSAQCPQCLSRTAEYRCDKCENERFCSDCYQTVHVARTMQKHQRVPIAENPTEMIPCELHSDQKLKYWCHACDMPICSDCKHLKRNYHQHDDLSNVAKEFEAKTNNEFETIESSLDNRMNAAEILITDIDNDIKSSTAKIKENMSLLRQMIDDYEKTIVEQILTIKTKEKEQIENSKISLRNEMQSLNLRKAMWKVLIVAEDHIKLLKVKQGFDDYIKKTKETLKELQIPMRIIYYWDGLDHLEELKKILQCGKYVEYSTPGLQKLITGSGTTHQLNLSNKNLIDQDMKIVADAVRKTTTLIQLNLNQNQIGDQGAKHLADALQNNTTLTCFYLHQNKIGDQGAQQLADALEQHKTLAQIYLSQNQIGDQGAEHLADALKQNKTLRQIHLCKNQISDQGVQHLADALKKNKTLTLLYLSQNQIGDQGAKYLADTLKHNTTLIYLDLHQNKIGNQSAQHLADALKQNKTLTYLHLGHNQIGDQGVQHFADALKHNTTLTNLYLQQNKFSQEAMQRAKEMLKTNIKLRVDW